MPPVEKFEFTRNWNNPSDFPTYEPDEAKVRADMQALPDELKTYLNEKMAPAVDEKVPGSRTVNGHPLTDDVKVTKEDVGLGKVDNTPDAEKPVSQPQQEALDAKADKTDVLQKDNATPYTPTQPYHPATKDYTDKSVAGAVMGQVPDGSITDKKLANDSVTEEKLSQSIRESVTEYFPNHIANKNNPHKVTADQAGASMVVSGSYPVAEGQFIHAGDVVDVVDGKVVGSSKRALSTLAEGSIVYLNENLSLVPFYVAKHNYESSLNGAGRTLLVRKDLYDKRAWHSSQVNNYASSDIDSWLNSGYKNILDAEVQTAIGTTKFRYTIGNGNYSISSLTKSIFLLSFTELGQSSANANVEGSVLPIADILKIAYLDGTPFQQWTRSPQTSQKELVLEITKDGAGSWTSANSACGSRPSFTLPETYQVFTDKRIPSQAIAIQDGEAGDTIEVIYSGVVKAPWAVAGNTFRDEAGGVFGFSPIDGVLEVIAKQASEHSLDQGIKIATGSYKGTGAAGSSNPNTLAIPSSTFAIAIGGTDNTAYGVIHGGFVWVKGSANGSSYANGDLTGSVFLDWNENSVSWYSPGGYNNQLNSSSLTYYYIIFYT